MKKWTYADASNGILVGTMKCNLCGKRVTEGQFRYRTNRVDEFIVQHRACCSEDGRWKYLDACAEHAANQEKWRRAAFDEFVARWGIPDDLCQEYLERG